MPSYVTPKKNTEFICYVALASQANPLVFQSNPTLAAGDAKVSIDGGAFNNLATLPAVTPASSVAVKITLSAAEMNGDNIQVSLIDAAGAQWCDVFLNIQTSARQVDDLAFPTTSGRGLDVSAGGEAGIDWANIGSPTTAQVLSGTTVGVATQAGTVTGNVDGNVGGNVTGSIGSLATQAKADVNEQVLDVMATDIVPEASGVPPATTTIFGMLARAYGALRNSVNVNSSTGKKQYFNDAGAAQWEKDFTDDGTIYNETKGNAP